MPTAHKAARVFGGGNCMSADKNKGGRPPAPPGLRRVNVPLRLPRWMAEWIAEQCAEGPPYKTSTQLIEAAMVKAYRLRPPKE